MSLKVGQPGVHPESTEWLNNPPQIQPCSQLRCAIHNNARERIHQGFTVEYPKDSERPIIINVFKAEFQCEAYTLKMDESWREQLRGLFVKQRFILLGLLYIFLHIGNRCVGESVSS